MLAQRRVDEQLAAVEQELLVHAALSEHRGGVVRLLGANLAAGLLHRDGAMPLLALLARRRRREALDCRHTVDLALEIAEAMAFLHSRTPPIVHRDLKSHNVLADDGSARLCDFGLVNTKTVRGHAELHGAGVSRQDVGHGVDAFAFGVLVNEMFARELPWDGLQPLDIKEKRWRAASGRARRARCRPPAKASCGGCGTRRMPIRPSFAQAIESLKTIQEREPSRWRARRTVRCRGGFARRAVDEF